MPEFIDPVFTKTSPKRSFSLNRKRAFWLVFAKTGSIISGTVETTFRIWCLYSYLVHASALKNRKVAEKLLVYTAWNFMDVQLLGLLLNLKRWIGNHRLPRGRDEIGECPLSWSVHSNFVCDGKYSERGWACTPHPHQRLSWFFHHDGMYARNRPLPLCVYSVMTTTVQCSFWLTWWMYCSGSFRRTLFS